MDVRLLQKRNGWYYSNTLVIWEGLTRTLYYYDAPLCKYDMTKGEITVINRGSVFARRRIRDFIGRDIIKRRKLKLVAGEIIKL